jgi:hypothetical protein
MNNLEHIEVNQLEPGDTIFCAFYPTSMSCYVEEQSFPKLVISIELKGAKNDLYSISYIYHDAVLQTYCLGDWYTLRLKRDADVCKM